MDFTREPIIETIITPKEGCKLVVRSSKGSGQEEFFVDAVEVVSFGNSFFFRSLERPKSFMVPATDYELLEVREARMVLKNVALERSVKIGGGKEAPPRPPREERAPQVEPTQPQEGAEEEVAAGVDARAEKKRDRRSRIRRRRGREEAAIKEEAAEAAMEGGESIPTPAGAQAPVVASGAPAVPAVMPSILPPPPTLISETISRYKDNAQFKGAFFTKGEEKAAEEFAEEPAEEAAEESVEPREIAEPSTGSDVELYKHQSSFTFDDEEEPDLFVPPIEPEQHAHEESENHPL